MPIRYSETKYSFKPPNLLTQNEFNYLKEILSRHPGISIAPKRDFWTEFSEARIILFIPLLNFLYLLLGGVSSMMSYKNFLDSRDNFYNTELKPILQKSQNYEDYCVAYKLRVKQTYLINIY